MSCDLDGGSFIFFFKQKTAYEISTRDWSSDVCSSDLSRCFCSSTCTNERSSFGARALLALTKSSKEWRAGAIAEGAARAGSAAADTRQLESERRASSAKPVNGSMQSSLRQRRA